MTDIGDNWMNLLYQRKVHFPFPTTLFLQRSTKNIKRLVFGISPEFPFPFGPIKHGPDVAKCCDLKQSLSVIQCVP